MSNNLDFIRNFCTKEDDYRYHWITGAGLKVSDNPFEGHSLRGADCLCEPRISIMHEHPDVRIFFHRRLTGA